MAKNLVRAVEEQAKAVEDRAKAANQSTKATEKWAKVIEELAMSPAIQVVEEYKDSDDFNQCHHSWEGRIYLRIQRMQENGC